MLSITSVFMAVIAASCTPAPDESAASKQSRPPVASPSIAPDGDDRYRRTIFLWDLSDQSSPSLRPITSGLGLAHPELSFDGEWVVFVREDEDGDTQIYTRSVRGKERRITDIPGGASDPAWSPDGRIAFAATSRRAGDNAEVDTDIFVMNADGSQVRRLAGTPQNDGAPDWSPDGEHVVFHSRFDDDRGHLWVASVGLHALDRLTPRGSWSAIDPAWSPDGRWIAFRRYFHTDTLNGRPVDGELALMHPDGTGTRLAAKRPVGPSLGRVWTEPSWSPDGRLILFEERRWDDTRSYIKVIDPWTSRSPETLQLESWVPLDPSWSQRGIVFMWQTYVEYPTPQPVPFSFEPAPPSDALGIDATITLAGSRCELEGRPRSVGPGRLMLRLVNRSQHEAHFTVVRLRGTIGELRRRGVRFRFGRPRLASLDPSTIQVWLSTERFPAGGRWGIACHEDKLEGPNGTYIVPVGIVGPITVG